MTNFLGANNVTLPEREAIWLLRLPEMFAPKIHVPQSLHPACEVFASVNH